MNAEKIAIFKMKTTADAKNLKDLIGQTVRPCKWEFSDYTDSDGESHKVLALELITAGNMRGIYRTEVRAFIEKFNIYIELFQDEPEAERPRIIISGVNSKRGNPYINFEIVEE